MNIENPYESPKSPSNMELTSATSRNWTDYSPAFNSAMWTGLTIQAILAVVTALMLDLGQTHRAFWVAMLCQWATVFIILARRPMAPTKSDLTIVRYGIIPLLIVVATLGPAMLHFLGAQ